MGGAEDVLVGRDAELALTKSMLDRVLAGTASTLLIEGEAGIGKSAVVESMIEAASSRRVAVYSSKAHPFERTRPFGAIANSLGVSRRSPDPRRASIARLLVGDSSRSAPMSAVTPDYRHRIVEELVDLVEKSCVDGPVLLVVEDLHWADSSTLLAIRSMTHSLGGGAPLLLVASFRPSPRTVELDELVDDALRSGAQMTRLGLLSTGEVDLVAGHELGGQPGANLSKLLAKAGGNPLWVVETVRSLSTEGLLRPQGTMIDVRTAELPDSLYELVVRRLRYLPEATLELLRVTALLGDTASVQDVATVARQSPTEIGAKLSDAFRARLLGELDEMIVFRHQLVHDAIYRDIPGPIRHAMHREIASSLDAAGADPLQVADHLVLGAARGDLEAVGWMRRAARHAAAGAPAVSVELLRRAESLLPGGHADADVIAAELADALLRAGKVVEAGARAEAVLNRRHREDADLPLRLSLIAALSLQNRAAELIEHVEAALSREPKLPTLVTSHMLAQASYGRTFSGDFAGGEATARQALEVAERAGSTALTVWSLTTLSVAMKWQGRYGEALRLTRRAVELAADPAHPHGRLRHPLFFLGMTLADSDLFDDARRAYAAASGEYDELGSMWLAPDTLLMSAAARFLVGDWDNAAPELEAGLHTARDHGNQILINQALAYQAVMAVARGDDHEAETSLEPAMAGLGDTPPGFGAEMVAVAAALLADGRDDPTTAYWLLKPSWDHDLERHNRYYHRDLAPLLTRLATRLGEGQVARRIADAVEEGAQISPEVASVQAAAHRCRGLAEGDVDQLLEAVRLARNSPRLLDRAGVCEEGAHALIAAGRAGEAEPLLDEALDCYDGIGALAWGSRVRESLRRLGVRRGARGPRRRPPHGWDSLTATQRAVSQLVTEGLTNREVAKRLHVSPHTVNTHLRHVFEKLSVANRAELAATVTRSATKGPLHSNE